MAVRSNANLKWIGRNPPMPPTTREKDQKIQALEAQIQDLEAQLASALRSSTPSRPSPSIFSLINNVPLAFWAVNLEGTVLLSQGGALAQAGLSPGQLVGENIFTLYAQQPEVLQPILAALRGKEGVGRIEMHNKTWECRCYPQFENNKLVGAFGFTLNVTTHAADQKAKRTSELRWKSFMFHTPDFVTLVDRNLNIVYINRTQAQSPENFVGKSISSFAYARDRQALEHALTRAFTHRESSLFEAQIPTPSGDTRWFQNKIYPVSEADKVVLVTIVSTDITAAKEAKQTRESLEDRLRHRQKLESLGIMAGGIAHDFNNLLVGILGNADLALAQLNPQETVYDDVKLILQGAERARELCQQLLAYSGKGTFTQTHVSLNQLVQDLQKLVSVSADKTTHIHTLFEPDQNLTYGDCAQIQQVVMNLLTNARDAMNGRRGTIQVRTGSRHYTTQELQHTELRDEPAPGTYVFLEVADQGCGMDKETRNRMFDPFFTTKTQGRGLGMASVLGIIRRHQGALFVQSTPNRGTTIRVLFPASNNAPTAPLSRPHTPQLSPQKTTTILIADDETVVRRVASMALQRKGFQVIEAVDGSDALQKFMERKDEISLVLLDLNMPAMNGQETFSLIRTLAPTLPVIFSSGFSKEHLPHDDHTHFLPKPFKAADLQQLACAMTAPKTP